MRTPSNESEARAVAEGYAATMLSRGYEELRPLAGEVKRSMFFGRLRLMSGPGGHLDEVVAPSGALYHVSVNFWPDEQGLAIELSVQEDAPPGGSISTQFVIHPDDTWVKDW